MFLKIVLGTKDKVLRNLENNLQIYIHKRYLKITVVTDTLIFLCFSLLELQKLAQTRYSSLSNKQVGFNKQGGILNLLQKISG